MHPERRSRNSIASWSRPGIRINSPRQTRRPGPRKRSKSSMPLTISSRSRQSAQSTIRSFNRQKRRNPGSHLPRRASLDRRRHARQPPSQKKGACPLAGVVWQPGSIWEKCPGVRRTDQGVHQRPGTVPGRGRAGARPRPVLFEWGKQGDRGFQLPPARRSRGEHGCSAERL